MTEQTKSNELFKQDIEQWLSSFVEVPSPKLGNWAPCPFAKEARISEEIKYLYSNSCSFEENIISEVEQFESRYKVIVVGTDPEKFSVERLKKFRERLRKDLETKDIWVLFDHPKVEEKLNGLNLNNGKYLLGMIQPLSKLNEAAKKLMSEGYYDNWDSEYLQLLKNSRPGFPS